MNIKTSHLMMAMVGAFSAPVLAQEVPQEAITVNGSVGLVSQYRFRGISLSDKDAAVQAGLTATHKSGLYAGAWGSNLAGFGTFGGSNLELDLYGGYKHQIGAVTVDAGLLWYLYPGTNNTDFAEPYISVSAPVGPAIVKVGAAYAPKQNALILGDEANLYTYGDAAVAIPNTPVTLKAHVGYSKGDTGLSPTGDYVDWLVGADFAYKRLTFGVNYVDTNLSPSSAARIGFDHDIADSAVVFSVSASF